MAKKRYTLYLDESRTSQANNGTPFFCMAGAIINNRDYNFVEERLNSIKRKIWSDLNNPEQYILHQMNISDASRGKLNFKRFPEYERFKARKFRKEFYKKLEKIYDDKKICIIGGSVNENLLNKYFLLGKNLDNTYRNNIDKYLVSLQLLLENFSHFLCLRNGIGKIIYESRQPIENEIVRDRFYHIKLMGSMYITKETMSNHLLGIDFIEKKANNAGLQIADFIPNAFAREHAGFGQMDKNNSYIRKLKYYRYQGNCNSQDRFGVKNMP